MPPIESLGEYFNHRRFHTEIEQRVAKHLQNESWDEAVTAAFKVLEERLRVLLKDPHGYGLELILKAFDEKKGVLTNIDAPFAEREGLKFLFMGSIKYFRNPFAHRFMEVSKDDALDTIIFANSLLSIIESNNRLRHLTKGIKTSIPQFRYGWNSGPLVLDVDGDGNTEIISRSKNPAGVIEVSKAIAGFLREQEVEQPPEPHYWFFSDAAILDMDGDGSTELICFCEGPTQGSALLVYRYEDGRYVLPKRSNHLPEDSNLYAPWFADATLADFDNDGYIEILSRPYIRIPEDIRPFHIQAEDGAIPPSGRILYVWKWQRVSRHFSLEHRSFQTRQKW